MGLLKKDRQKVWVVYAQSTKLVHTVELVCFHFAPGPEEPLLLGKQEAHGCSRFLLNGTLSDLEIPAGENQAEVAGRFVTSP